MILELLPSETLSANEAAFNCEGVKQCDNISFENANEQKEGSADELLHKREVDIVNCSRLRQVIHKEDNLHGKERDFNIDDNTDCNELIAYWMMEGFLGRVDSVEESYKKGHDLFMEFRHVKMPRPQFYTNKRLNNLASVSTYLRYRGLDYTKMGLGFVDLFDFEKHETPRLGKLVPHKGVIRTLADECTCLLLDGNQLDRQVLGNFKRGLKNLAYFSPGTNVLERQLPTLNLRVLILRGCTFLEKIEECIGEMSDLEILEISGPCSVKKLPDIFKKVTKIRSLNLSYLGVEYLPKHSFPKLKLLKRLILRGCYGLLELPSTRDMADLKLIDLYGATSLQKLSTTIFRTHHLEWLDLTNTHVKRVPCLFNYSGGGTYITHLFLRNVLEIYVFDIIVKLLKLKVLDLSGAKNLKQIDIRPLKELEILDLSGTSLVSLPEDCFNQLTILKDLNLSNTDLPSLPKSILDVSTLEFLNLSGCKKLKCVGEIPLGEVSFGQWPCLQILNLSDTSIEKFIISEQHSLEHLQVLNLSNTSIKELPSMSRLKRLMHLLVAGCSEIASVPDLETLTLLEVLDLSGTRVENGVLDKASRKLLKLRLKDCSMINDSLNLASFTLLEELDLRGSSVSEFPQAISEMTHLTRLGLPHQILMTGFDWGQIDESLLRKISWDQPANLLESVKIIISNEVIHSMLAKPLKENGLFHLVDSQDSWEAYFKQFQFSPKEENSQTLINFCGVELVFKGHHPLARKEPYIKPQSSSVEIHGFPTFPKESKILEKAVNVALVNCSSTFSLSDEYFHSAATMKVCWINNCPEMNFVLRRENADVFGVLETLVLSNLTSLKAFYDKTKNSLPKKINSLKHMYIDCCPILQTAISPTRLPENLETLHVKFCDELKILCEDAEWEKITSITKDEHKAVTEPKHETEPITDASGSTKHEIEAATDASENTTSKYNLPKLLELNLLGLLKLEHIGANLPFLQTLIISQCPELKDIGSLLQCAGSCLTRVTLDSCPQLKHVFSSTVILEKIEVLEIRSCDGLEAVFDPIEPSLSEAKKPELPTLQRLQLWNLPNLRGIEGQFPDLKKREIKYCSRFPKELWPEAKTP